MGQNTSNMVGNIQICAARSIGILKMRSGNCLPAARARLLYLTSRTGIRLRALSVALLNICFSARKTTPVSFGTRNGSARCFRDPPRGQIEALEAEGFHEPKHCRKEIPAPIAP